MALFEANSRYRPLRAHDLAPYILSLHIPAIDTILSMPLSSEQSLGEKDLEVTEVGDGFVNMVFVVKNKTTNGAVVCKQALPYLRCVGEAAPLTLERTKFEYHALRKQKSLCPEYIPLVYHYDEQLYLISE
jgi:5-methylthioribose kinase